MTTADMGSRRQVLTNLDSTLLVEAAAGTGKTSLMAGRVAMLLAAGRSPRHIAAITFTEPAAAELALRIRATIDALLRGEMPVVLAPVLPQGLSAEQQQALAAASQTLDELTATTIYGFCHTMIRSHAVAANLDPGSKVMDAATADGMFDSIFSQWLNDRLSLDGEAGDDDPVAVLSRSDPLNIAARLRQLAMLRGKHRTARPLPLPQGRPDIDFIEAVDQFARWHAGSQGDPQIAELVDDLQSLAAFYADALAGSPPFARLWRLAQPTRVGSMRRRTLDLKPYRRTTAWKKTHGEEIGQRLAQEAEAHFDRTNLAYRALLGHIGQALITSTSAALDEMLGRYTEHKRAAAVLDFEDLLLHARALVATNEAVRLAVARRYHHILVDEFQDTDQIQAEILFLIGVETRPRQWQDARLRPGALFLVGDPKQAIYRFRGADIDVYQEARDNISDKSSGAIVQVTANFRSRRGIIKYVNDRFAAVLSHPSQPGYVALTPTVEDDGTLPPCVTKITIDSPPGESPDAQRDAEAEAVAETCRRLIGAFEITRADGSRSLTQPGDIALLAPTGTELWRYERALEAQRIAVASQAGKTLMQRQETQDILVLLRTLADSRDTLALGALLRGPLVGLTDDDLLRIAAELPEGRGLSLRTDPEAVKHPLARSVLEKLRELRRKATTTTPSLLLSEAVEQLHVRVVLSARHRNRSSRALANIDALIERARAYDVTGLRTLVHDVQRDWERQTRLKEGRSDTSDDAVELVTMHSSKGLEWPIVIPINTVTRFRGADEFVHRRSDNTLHWILGGVPPPHLSAARDEESRSEARQRERLWYVACTRARDLLVVPLLPSADSNSWSRIVDLDHAALPELDLGALPPPGEKPDETVTNDQTPERFAAEAELVAAASTPLVWRRPSDHDRDRALTVVGVVDPANETAEIEVVTGAGRLRGIVLHKLMEEFLTGELTEDEFLITARAEELLTQLVPDQLDSARDLPGPGELASTALRTLHLPELAALRPVLKPEIAVWSANAEELLAGRADAVAYDGDTPTLVLDWKSDVAPSAQVRAQHRGQLQEYLHAIGASRGAVVYMSLGEITWV